MNAYHSAVWFLLICFDYGRSEQLVQESSATFSGSLSIAAFNVRIFGQKKMQNPLVADTLTKILCRYHLVLIQEIRDSKGTAVYDLLKMMNKAGGNLYSIIVSPRLGRTTSKEQYAYIYRTDLFKVRYEYVYQDTHDHFERPPYVALFQSPQLDFEFGVIGIHTSPSKAQEEIDYLYDVYNEAKSRWGNDNILLMGDFNGACSYISDWSKIRLTSRNSGFYWLINDGTDTTSGRTYCAYDRVISSGAKMTKAIDPFSPKAFYFDRFYGLTNEQALAVSDHYPVEISIRTSKQLERSRVKSTYDIADKSQDNLSKRDAYKVKQEAEQTSFYDINSAYTKTGAYATIQIKHTSPTISDAVQALQRMHSTFPVFISDLHLDLGKKYLKRFDLAKLLTESYSYDTLANFYANRKVTVDLRLVFWLDTTTVSWLSLSTVVEP